MKPVDIGGILYNVEGLAKNLWGVRRIFTMNPRMLKHAYNQDRLDDTCIDGEDDTPALLLVDGTSQADCIIYGSGRLAQAISAGHHSIKVRFVSMNDLDSWKVRPGATVNIHTYYTQNGSDVPMDFNAVKAAAAPTAQKGTQGIPITGVQGHVDFEDYRGVLQGQSLPPQNDTVNSDGEDVFDTLVLAISNLATANNEALQTLCGALLRLQPPEEGE